VKKILLLPGDCFSSCQRMLFNCIPGIQDNCKRKRCRKTIIQKRKIKLGLSFRFREMSRNFQVSLQ
jgi:hypothetical protein